MFISVSSGISIVYVTNVGFHRECVRIGSLHAFFYGNVIVCVILNFVIECLEFICNINCVKIIVFFLK